MMWKLGEGSASAGRHYLTTAKVVPLSYVNKPSCTSVKSNQKRFCSIKAEGEWPWTSRHDHDFVAGQSLVQA
ncbi:hypothetical protein TNCV_3861891 [Trichonephila clavipes]|nr:hypothetical protein TNCV_3861891 [Trichonephila clavipes]